MSYDTIPCDARHNSYCKGGTTASSLFWRGEKVEAAEDDFPFMFRRRLEAPKVHPDGKGDVRDIGAVVGEGIVLQHMLGRGLRGNEAGHQEKVDLGGAPDKPRRGLRGMLRDVEVMLPRRNAVGSAV